MIAVKGQLNDMLLKYEDISVAVSYSDLEFLRGWSMDV